uniref:JmjC domain-containing protein n=1 Tax=Trichogramma kaykai TaxID=54128 RepID=A0ABD2VVF9_9HYME
MQQLRFKMADVQNSNEIKANNVLLESKEPLLFKNILHETKNYSNWDILNWNWKELGNIFADKKLPFRVGKKEKTKDPQWEVGTPIVYKTMNEFLNDAKKESCNWYYFDYKHIREWFKDRPDIVKSFDWKLFDLDFDGSDSTMWIGSEGAHTSCHQDTYGCNIVAQIHGRKLWLLFPPDCSSQMNPSRTPYEESTIYSKYNFFTPSQKEIDAIQTMIGKVKMVILEPNDVLFIPNGWWHYVESLDISLSVNVWIPQPDDCKARLKESLVNLIVNTIGHDLPKAADHPDSSLLESIKYIKLSLKECKNLKGNEMLEPPCKKKKSNIEDDSSFKNLENEYVKFIKTVPNFTNADFEYFLTKNSCMDGLHDEQAEDNLEESDLTVVETLVDAFSHPDIISKVYCVIESKLLK